MASYRSKYRQQFEGYDKGDAPPVLSQPMKSAEPAAEAAPPPEPPVNTDPGRDAGNSAIRRRLEELDKAEEIRREPQPAQEPPRVEDPVAKQQPSVQDIIATTAVPEAAKAWLRAHPDYITDPTKNAQLIKMHNVAEYQAGGEFTPAYFDRMEILLGLKSESPRPAAPQRQPAPRAGSVPMSAPVAREAPSMRSGRPMSHRAPLTPEQREAAHFSGISEEEYSRNYERMMRLKAAGAIQ